MMNTLSRDQSLRSGVAAYVYPESAIPAGSVEAQLEHYSGNAMAIGMETAIFSGREEQARMLLAARTEGAKEGEQLATLKLQGELELERKRVTALLAAFELERQEYFSKMEGQLVTFALAIAAKILHREAQVDRMLVAGLVRVTLERLQQNTKVTVRVRPEEVADWQKYFAGNETHDVQIAADADLFAGNCVVETESGTAEMGVDAQLKEIEQGLFDLMAQRPVSQ
jgi:flagellar assembly protein FliH